MREVFAAIKAPISANRTLAAASAMFGWCVKQDLVAVNPCVGIAKNPSKSRERVLSDDEIPLVWDALGNGVEGRALKVVLLTGQRPGEVRAMRWEHVRGGWWHMPGAPSADWPGTKNGKDNRAWLHPAAREIMGNVVSLTGAVFPGAGRLHDFMRARCERLGFASKVTPHDLRRSFLTTVTKLKFGRHLMDLIANHRTKGTTDVYDVYTYTDEIREAMDAAASRIMMLARGGFDSAASTG
jgi:integrase